MNRKLHRFFRRRHTQDSEIELAAQEGYLALLVLDREVLPAKRRYTMAELAAKSGTDLSTAQSLWRAVGFPDLPEELPGFTDDDVKAMKSFIETLTASGIGEIDLDSSLTIARVLGSSLATAADAVSESVADRFRLARDAGVSDEELASVIAGQSQLPQLAEMVDHIFRLQLRAAFWRRLALVDTDHSGSIPGSIGFVDLVGFTALSEEIDEEELGGLVRRFNDMAYDTVASANGRVVKTIGDAVMFVAHTPEITADIATQITARSLSDPALPRARAGIAEGELVVRQGDYFGPVVNLASRLTDMARPGTVLAPTAMGEQLANGGRFDVHRLGRRRVRDIGRIDICSIKSLPA
ncbi:unannotated protein [freshwater metagenome]|jgi:adenylate cyclase|uniref:Unannotated protein n=1 Tax=freshwater metagenome TaxID=449393 RepID=A0A6J7GYW9_9ZZZZ|nr:hypothetical protein [Actinomycetota bacterium]MSV40405.1 hypothetical protein [Actinomycetota bacterium]MSV94406.1 hypothetical protein [Actinomycetota bacterium]MSW61302.1 hypothetical protein [Actinomycetota bacterium]MSY44018.1 hypothetical protein [Actinomycetota bacterium]